MYPRARLAADYRFLFKALANVRNGGCHVNIWLPELAVVSSAAIPLAMMSHGGGWTVGSVDNVPYNQIRYFLEHGIAVASFEYRHLPHVQLKDIRSDLMDAYIYVQQRLNGDLREAGSSIKIDGARCSFMGWSAGGSNTLWLASDITACISKNGKGSLPPLRAIISSYPLSKLDPFGTSLSDWNEYLATNPSMDLEWKRILAGECNTAFKVEHIDPSNTDILSTDPVQQEQALADRSPSETPVRLMILSALVESRCLCSVLLGEDSVSLSEASPIHLLSPDFPPTCMLVATEDKLLPTHETTDVYDRLKEMGVDSLLVTCQGMEHGEAECMPGMKWMEGWWEEAIRPSLDFAITRMKA